ncbi:hypothetical protein NE604_00950 [Anaerofustis stercorihominis]|uniref:Uncharacterized protein n=1 Tax=Anaerofustis stercorihominis DSM 17244 TaxID=445971 RepID=B1C727_9FIRM|nr:hypothetical protein [Anaerofustis stercorihominis]EDS72814.1 hypothetical protein ANASTE_00524 [Anaerofustis stercorihominis DSM 17244]MCQ4794211.1 hypothetical protein [Anaerofustis stercorihominis]
MPQVTKEGKYIFGWSVIKEDYTLNIPSMAMEEYEMVKEDKVFIFSGSKSTGGFCVTRKGLLKNSKLRGILYDNPRLMNYELKEGELIKYKGRSYAYLNINDGEIKISKDMIDKLDLKSGDKLLSIRSSDIAFTMGLKGQLIERAKNYEGYIEVY